MYVCVYIISTHYGTYYCGMTNSNIRRWKQHVNGQSKYLSIYKPKEIVHVEFYNSYKSARKREIQIKQSGVGRTARLLRLSGKIKF